MKKVDFNKLQAGDLVEVPRTQFAPMRSGWNGWLFSEAVVIRKGVGRKKQKECSRSGNENTSGKEQLRDYRGYILRRECFYYASSKERKKHFEEIRNRGRRELLQIH